MDINTSYILISGRVIFPMLFAPSEVRNWTNMVDVKPLLRFSNKKDGEYLTALKAAIYAFEGPEKGSQTACIRS